MVTITYSPCLTLSCPSPMWRTHEGSMQAFLPPTPCNHAHMATVPRPLNVCSQLFHKPMSTTPGSPHPLA